MIVALSLFAFDAKAQVVPDDRPVVPSSGVAAEGGPGTLWVNPANLAYDSDVRYGVYVAHDLGSDPTSIAATTGVGGVQVGISNVSIPNGRSDWALDYATSVRLPKRINVGARISWNLKQGTAPNFVAYDFGLAWRPLPWLGFGAVAHNISTPDLSAPANTGIGLALRPFGSFATLGIDFRREFDVGNPHDVGALTLRLRPIHGLYLRGEAETDFNGVTSVGGGFETYFGHWGGAANVRQNLSDGSTGLVGFIGTDEPGEALVRAGDKVPVLVLDHRPPYESPGGLLAQHDTTWLEILELLRRAEDDRAVRGVAIVLQGGGLSWAQAEEIRARITTLESEGKHVVAYLYGSGGRTDYLVACAASKIILHPSGDLWLTGVASEMQFLRGALDLVGVEPQFVRRREYKSAVEQYTATEPSPPSIEQTDALLDDLSDALVAGIATGRKKDPADVKALIDGGPYSAQEALEKGLVDELAYPDEMKDKIAEHLGRSSVNLVGLSDMPQPHSGWKSASQIAIVYIDGAIVSGESSNGRGGLFGGGKTSGSETVDAALERARNDDQVKAVVLRVDSPGGSSFASDDIHRAVERVEDKGKPVVVSMGGVAASGGYYVACGADAIWAEPTTITGSIGVYSGKFAMGGLFDRFGITTTAIERGRNSNIDSEQTPWDPMQLQRMDDLVGSTYEDFKSKVAAGRGITTDTVEEVARGHVWSGKRAVGEHLVDGLGGFHEAIEDARARAGIAAGREVSLISYDGSGNLLETLAPTQMSISERALVFAFPDLIARINDRPTVPHGLMRLADAWAPAELFAEHPQDLWMYDPSLTALDGR